MSNGDHGYIVVCGSSKEYFSDAGAAMRYAAFMGELGYDAVYFDAQIQDDGTIKRMRMQTEQEIRACFLLGL